jgi:glycosyltransferase involved in cell wall biosynthesis
MKLLLIIDHFGPGGAQRQIVELACGMKRRGHEVEMFVYYPEHDFFRPLLEENRITVHGYTKRKGFSFGVLAKLIGLVRGRRFDLLVSFLSSANVYAELAAPFSSGSKLVVSERTSHHDDKAPLQDWLRRAMHLLSDKVVANSRSHCVWLKRRWWLRKRATYVYNGIDLQKFHPSRAASESIDELHLIGVGRIGPEKNILNLIKALDLLHKQTGNVPQISWAGPRDESASGRKYREEIDDALLRLPEVRRRWHWLGVQSDVGGLLRRFPALIHPSFYEGLPNVVCEALACGLPVLASDVCDHPLLVAEGERGFLFDPQLPESIAAAIAKLANLSIAERIMFSRNSRQYAEGNLGVEKMVSAYERLFSQLLRDPAPDELVS